MRETTSEKRDYYNKEKLLVATSEQGYCNARCNIRNKKETNVTKKYYLLQQLNKASAT
jgi:hypothetical protein